MRLFLFALSFLVGPTHAEGLKLDPWTREDTYRQSALTALLVIDWAQTRWFIRHNEQCAGTPGCAIWPETNPLLGTYPTIGKVNNYFAASIIGHAAIGYMLPSAWRHGWQYVWIGIELNTTARNQRLGVKMDF